MYPETVVGCSLFGTAAFGMNSYMLKSHIEYPTKYGIYPELDLSDVKVSIHTAALNEENYIENTLKTVVAQPLYQKYHPTNIELILVDSHSEDRTVEIAELYVDRIVEAPRGKLSARRIGIDESPNADIIVSIDSDTLYPNGWLNLLLSPFEDERVVAVGGSSLAIKGSVNLLFYIGILYDNFSCKLLGRNSAFRREAFLQVGGWDETIDQMNLHAMVEEEERNLWGRMSRIGKVKRELSAVCYEMPRRFKCNLPDTQIANYCEMITAGERF